jgi:DNA gyrase/topoisomerase IV subunit B
MLQVTVEDAVGSERQIRTLMGDNAELRRNWITANVAFGESEEELTHMDGAG